MTIDEDEFFENLSQLVAHYRKDADGLCTELTQELKNEENSKTGGYHDVDLKAFKEAGWVIEDRDIEVDKFIRVIIKFKICSFTTLLISLITINFDQF